MTGSWHGRGLVDGFSGNRLGEVRAGRVSARKVEWVNNRMSERDWRIVEAVNRLKVVTGQQLQRLFFSSLSSSRSQVVSRARVLKRLVAWRVLVPLERRIGGAGRGSSGQCFSLDSVGQRIVAERQLAAARAIRVRRPGTPGERTLRHSLAVSELFVRLVELGRANGFPVVSFQAEPESWWPNGLRGFVKPDAYALLELRETRDHWWIEIDMATESLPTLNRKLLTYLDFLRRGQVGPEGVMPRVLVSAVTSARAGALQTLVERLPSPAGELFTVVEETRAAERLYEVLRE